VNPVDKKQCSTSRPLTQDEQAAINRFKTNFEELGGDPDRLLPDAELSDVLWTLYYIIRAHGWDPSNDCNWVRADRLYMMMKDAQETATAGGVV
jgi:hypothetical protein